jgi:6-phospho-3-hexuloisomerase
MNIKEVQKNILDEIELVLDKQKDQKKLLKIIKRNKRIFLTGSGRSGLIAEMFAMRLMQLGLKSYIIGESTTPSLRKNDLLIALSGSGKTNFTKRVVEEARRKKAKIIILTADKNSPISKKANIKIILKAKTKSNSLKSIQPLGSLFENSAHLFLESIILLLKDKLKVTEKEMRENHSRII